MNKGKKNLRNMLKGANYLMIDHLDALEVCKKNGLNKSTKIISFNPYLVLGLNFKIISPEQDISSKHYNNLTVITKELTDKIYSKIYSFSEDNSLAIYISRYIIGIQNIIHKTSLVMNLVKDSSLVVVVPNYTKEGLNNNINGKFYNILENQKNIKTYKLDYKSKDQAVMGRDPISNFWLRFDFEGLNSLLFRLFVIFCNKLNFLWKGKRVLFSHENNLLKGTASYLFRKGFFIQKLTGNINNKKLYKNKILDDITDITNPILNEFQKKIISEEITVKNKLFFKKQLKKYISDYFQYKDLWREYFIKNKNIFACLVGTPAGPKELSCIEVAKKQGIITASFQHGISKEIKADTLFTDVLFENSLTDHYFVFNNKAADISIMSRYNISKISNVGLPEDMRRCVRTDKNKYKSHPILYASTTLYCGNKGIPSRAGESDLSKAIFEINIIENILSKIPHNVHYKPYYSKRYPGAYIELERAKIKNNIYINNQEVDLRYIVGNFRVIITSRATSTLGWCVLSDKPVIYIENKDSRLNKEASRDFKKNLFYFDVLEKNWEKNLHNFLSQPLENIEKEWKSKMPFKHKFIEKYFGSKTTNAEKECASILLSDILNAYKVKKLLN